MERDRGYGSTEDLLSAGYFSAEWIRELHRAGDQQGRLGVARFYAGPCLDAEQHRIENSCTLPACRRMVCSRSSLAADQFVILPRTRPEEEKLAQASGDEARTRWWPGYHRFTDWGRDTMC